MEYMLLPLKRYADFTGRSGRQEYWMYVLFLFLAQIVTWLVAAVLGVGMLFLLFLLGTFVPSVAVSVRRAHDQDKSGWFILIPVYGFIMMFLEGTRGPNRFGPPVSMAGSGHGWSSAGGHAGWGHGHGQGQGQVHGHGHGGGLPHASGGWASAPPAAGGGHFGPTAPQPHAAAMPPQQPGAWHPAPAPAPQAGGWQGGSSAPTAPASWAPSGGTPPSPATAAPNPIWQTTGAAPAAAPSFQAPTAPQAQASASAPAPAPAPRGSNPELRSCPFCAEEIRTVAIKCRFCGSDVEPLGA